MFRLQPFSLPQLYPNSGGESITILKPFPLIIGRLGQNL